MKLTALALLALALPAQIPKEHWLNVKFPQSVVRVPFRILTEEEDELLDKNYRDIKKQVDEAFKKKNRERPSTRKRTSAGRLAQATCPGVPKPDTERKAGASDSQDDIWWSWWPWPGHRRWPRSRSAPRPAGRGATE